MKIAEFLKTLLDLVDSGQFPSSDTVNPGRRAGEDGRYKWSPPLQQHLDSVKDSVAPSDETQISEPQNVRQPTNPGRRAGEDGRYKWSPPLQQHLDSVKDSVGPSDETQISQPQNVRQPNYNQQRIAPVTQQPSMPE